MATIKQAWGAIDYTAGSDLAAGAVVAIGSNAVGVASYPIANGAVGGVVVAGVVEFPKASGSVSLGDALYWDSSASKATTTVSTNTYIGIATAAAESADTTITALLNMGFVDTTGSSST